jgi:hypothetical protein
MLRLFKHLGEEIMRRRSRIFSFDFKVQVVNIHIHSIIRRAQFNGAKKEGQYSHERTLHKTVKKRRLSKAQ